MTKTKAPSQQSLTEGPLLGKILKFSLPLIATGLLQTLYNASDMVVVGRFAGSHAMGAVGACGALINLIINLFMGLSVGVGVCTAQGLGAQRYDDVRKVVHTALISSTVCGVFVALFGYFLASPLLSLMGTPEEVFAEAVPYMKAYFVGIPATMVYNFMASVLRSAGDTKRPLIFLTVSGIFNVILNLVMVICFGKGALGVGIATAASQYLAAAMIVVYMLRMEGCCRLCRKEMRVDKQKLWLIVKIGLPAGLQGVLFSLSNVIIQSTVNSYGDIVVDGNSAAGNIEGFVYISMNAMHQAAITFVGQNVGAGKYERIKKITLQCMLIVFLVGFVMGNAAYIFGDGLLSIYEPENEAVRQAGMVRLSIICTTYFLCGLMDVGSGVLRGMGRSVLSMMISLIGSCVFRMIWIYTVCAWFSGDIRVLYYSYPISWLLTGAAHFTAAILSYKGLFGSRGKKKTA